MTDRNEKPWISAPAYQWSGGRPWAREILEDAPGGRNLRRILAGWSKPLFTYPISIPAGRCERNRSQNTAPVVNDR